MDENFANRNLDREQIAEAYMNEMAYDPEKDLPFTVTDIPVPDGLEDRSESELPAMGPGMNDDLSLEEFMAAIQAAVSGVGKSTEQRALEAILPIIDAGIDVMAMEGYVKTPDELRTVEGQMKIRGELVDGVLAAFHVFGVDMEDVRNSMLALERSGYPFKQEPHDIEDRLTVWDEVSIVNHLYGPRVAGQIFTHRAEHGNRDSDG